MKFQIGDKAKISLGCWEGRANKDIIFTVIDYPRGYRKEDYVTIRSDNSNIEFKAFSTISLEKEIT